MTKKVRVASNLATAGPFRSGAAVARTTRRNATIELPSAGPEVARTTPAHNKTELPSTAP